MDVIVLAVLIVGGSVAMIVYMIRHANKNYEQDQSRVEKLNVSKTEDKRVSETTAAMDQRHHEEVLSEPLEREEVWCDDEGVQICGTCGTTNFKANKFCRECGVSLLQQRTGQPISASHSSRRLTVEDGVKVGVGMFIVLPLIIIGAIFFLFVLCVGIGSV